MISPKDYVFFTIEKEYATTLTTSSGFTLDLAMGGQPGNELHHVSECGIVKHLPKKLSYPKGAAIDLQVGDKIYFHFHTVSEENRVRATENEEEKLYMVHYGEIYCRVRDGKIQTLSEYVLCDPMYEGEKDLLTKNGIFKKRFTSTSLCSATIHHLPLKGNVDGLKKGDEILFSSYSDIPIRVEGRDYFRMRLSDIMARYEY